MPPVTSAVGDIWEVSLKCKLEMQDHINVMHFAVLSPVDDIQLRLLKALVDCLLLNMIPGLSSAFHVVGAVGRKVGPTLGNAVEYFHTNEAVASNGLATGDYLPSYCSALVSIHTATPGRTGRGRFFLGGVPEGSTVGSMLTTEGAFWAALLLFIACLVEKFVVGDPPPSTNAIQIGVLSKKDHTPGTPYAIEKFSAANNIVPHQLLSHNASRKVGRGS